MPYSNREGNTLSLNECMTADSFFMEADVYIHEPLEMHFSQKGELKAGKEPNKKDLFMGGPLLPISNSLLPFNL